MNSDDPLKNVDAITVLRLFETDVSLRRYEQAEECLLWILSNCSVHGSQPNKVILPSYDAGEVTYVATRIVSSICHMFSDPGFGIEDKDFYKYAIGHGSLTALFGVSGFNNADHVIQNMLEPVEGEKAREVSRKAFNKILILHGIHSGVKIPLENYLGSHPRHVLWMVLLAVATLFCVTERENSARNNLISSLMNKIDVSAFEPSMLGWLCIAWMHCSYATIAEKNHLKKILNKILVGWMGRIGIKQNQIGIQRKNKDKPVLLVINEYFKTSHAMYRCYAPTIKSLREHFYVVGMTEKKDCDENSINCFDEHHFLEWGDNVVHSLKKAIASIRDIGPYAIYYPSIGMHISSILLSNLRLAPCQWMTMGHPASTHSDTIDYCLMENQFLANADQFSERIICIKDNFSAFFPHSDQPPRSEILLWREQRIMGEPVRIAITGSSMKINYEFVEVLAEIQKRCDRKIEFHFTPNLNNLSLNLFKKRISESLENVVVYPPCRYRDYLKNIAKCHIHISPFPFSSTNSLIDSLLLGLPMVVMEVKDAELKVDAGIVRKLRIEEMEPAKNKQEFIELACRFVNDDELRERVEKRIMSSDVEGIFFNHSSMSRDSTSFIAKMINNHVNGLSGDNRILSEQDLFHKEWDHVNG